MTALFVDLARADDESRFGGKAAQLARALAQGLPVPGGVALPYGAAADLLAPASRDLCSRMIADLGGLVAVRSSAVGEDSASASFAGQHATVLGVASGDQLAGALREVMDSAHTAAARAYRHKLGLAPEPRMGIVVQRLVRAEVAGVLFTRDPLSGADVRLIEASWGLGEAVVQGLVTPDRFRVARGGAVLEQSAGDKDLELCWSAQGGTREVEVVGARRHQLCLAPHQLTQLDALASQCEAAFGGSQDLEFAFCDGTLHLLQRRAITRGP